MLHNSWLVCVAVWAIAMCMTPVNGSQEDVSLALYTQRALSFEEVPPGSFEPEYADTDILAKLKQEGVERQQQQQQQQQEAEVQESQPREQQQDKQTATVEVTTLQKQASPSLLAIVIFK